MLKQKVGILHPGMMGLYLDVNAIAPQRALRIGQQMKAARVDFVDGGIIGVPLREPGKTWLYLSGDKAEEAATFREAGLPGEFHAAAEMIYRRLTGFKDAPATPSLEEVLKTLTQPSEEG